MKDIDLLFKNANVLTLDHQNKRAGSVAVSNGEICGIWDELEPPQGAINVTDQTNVVDLQGATFLPCFIDTNNHILMYAISSKQVNCSTPTNKTIKDILELIGSRAKVTPKGEWVEGYGYDDTLLYEKRHPTRYDLDQVSPNHPVVIKHISGHLAAVNSLALKYARLHDGISDPKGGHIGRDDTGYINGILYETIAINPITNQITNRTIDQMISKLYEGLIVYDAQGMTTNTEAGI